MSFETVVDNLQIIFACIILSGDNALVIGMAAAGLSPVALSAYFLKGVVPEWDLKDIYLGMIQFMVIQGDRPDPDLRVPANCSLVAKPDLWRISLKWPLPI